MFAKTLHACDDRMPFRNILVLPRFSVQPLCLQLSLFVPSYTGSQQDRDVPIQLLFAVSVSKQVKHDFI